MKQAPVGITTNFAILWSGKPGVMCAYIRMSRITKTSMFRIITRVSVFCYIFHPLDISIQVVLYFQIMILLRWCLGVNPAKQVRFSYGEIWDFWFWTELSNVRTWPWRWQIRLIFQTILISNFSLTQAPCRAVKQHIVRPYRMSASHFTLVNDT